MNQQDHPSYTWTPGRFSIWARRAAFPVMAVLAVGGFFLKLESGAGVVWEGALVALLGLLMFPASPRHPRRALAVLWSREVHRVWLEEDVLRMEVRWDPAPGVPAWLRAEPLRLSRLAGHLHAENMGGTLVLFLDPVEGGELQGEKHDIARGIHAEALTAWPRAQGIPVAETGA